MAAAPRSLLAFWAGGAVEGAAPVVQAGVRSMLAPWAGGASSGVAPGTQAGVRSMLAPWMGGASQGAAPVVQAGMRSMLGFWMGGIAPGPPGPEPTPELVGGQLDSGRRRRIQVQNQALIAALSAFAAQGAFQ